MKLFTSMEMDETCNIWMEINLVTQKSVHSSKMEQSHPKMVAI